jgi:tRNA (guanine37-N1)-methyltransferase
VKHWNVNLLTLFPEMFPGSLGHSIAGKALARGDWSYTALQIRDFALDKHKTVDDTPFGGGAGIENALLSLPNAGRKIYLSPRGKPLTQALAQELAATPTITLLCGRYEGVDQRLLDAYDFEEISIGDFVLSGGEPAALILMDACIRLLPGVMGNDETAGEESFAPGTGGLLEYPHYTRPASWTTRDGRILDVPEILTGGDHGKIAKWRRAQAETITAERRPDLLKDQKDKP